MMLFYLSVLKRSLLQNYHTITISAFFVVCLSITLGAALGKLLSLGAYVGDYETLIANNQPLPSRIYDVNGNLITEISQGSRELLSQNELTRNLTYSLLGREDSTFFEHNGFSLIGTMRAFTYIVLNRFFGTGTAGGGSTLTQQLAGSLKADRKDISISRKLRELWWSFIFEKYYAKSEILVTYLNNVYFGDGNYGIEAASRFFFGHSAQDNSIVESVLAVIQLARPNGDFSPLRQPEMAKLRQEAVLDKIVELKLMTRAQVEQASQEYWDNFDLTKVNQRSPKRIDEAPYFSDYVARILEQNLYGTNNLLQAGYNIYTTIDLNVQRQVEKIVQEEMKTVDDLYHGQNLNLFSILEKVELPELGRLRTLLGLNLNLSGGRAKRAAEQALQSDFAPTLEAIVTVLGIEGQIPMLKMSSKHLDKFFARTVPETALMAIDNHTGNIVAMIGGRTYNINEARLFNRAVDARVPLGSAFKPLYFSAAFEARAIDASTSLPDGPYRFVNPNGQAYIPANYHARTFHGSVLPRIALQLSLNIPAVHVLDMLGFDQGIGMATRLLGITDPGVIRRDFPFVFPVALGTAPASPMQLLRAYTAFMNRGIPQDPNPIRYVEDRNGQVVYNYEQVSLHNIQDTSRRILSEQTAYVMTKMLESVPSGGTLYSSKLRYEEKYGPFKFPLAAKTGTAENWSDGWTVGYTPEYTVVVWVGFDQAGNSLGEALYGGRAAGPMFMRTMGLLHQGKNNDTNFHRPDGVYSTVLDKRNGYRWVPSCGEGNKTYEWFLDGTGPTKDCTQAPKTEVFNFSITSYQEDRNNIEEQDSREIDISNFDFLNQPAIPLDDTQDDENVANQKINTPIDNYQSNDNDDGILLPNKDTSAISGTPADLRDNSGNNSSNQVTESGIDEQEPETSTNTQDLGNNDQFLKHQQNTRSELDAIIESNANP